MDFVKLRRYGELDGLDKERIPQLISGAYKIVPRGAIYTVILHGSAVTRYGTNNDLDLLVFCNKEEDRTKLEAATELSKSPLDVNFRLPSTFLDVCRKPFLKHGRGIGGKIERADEEQRYEIVISLLHGFPVYHIPEGNQLLREGRDLLKAYHGEKIWQETLTWWQEEVRKRNELKMRFPGK